MRNPQIYVSGKMPMESSNGRKSNWWPVITWTNDDKVSWNAVLSPRIIALYTMNVWPQCGSFLSYWNLCRGPSSWTEIWMFHGAPELSIVHNKNYVITKVISNMTCRHHISSVSIWYALVCLIIFHGRISNGDADAHIKFRKDGKFLI